MKLLHEIHSEYAHYLIWRLGDRYIWAVRLEMDKTFLFCSPPELRYAGDEADNLPFIDDRGAEMEVPIERWDQICANPEPFLWELLL